MNKFNFILVYFLITLKNLPLYFDFVDLISAIHAMPSKQYTGTYNHHVDTKTSFSIYDIMKNVNGTN